MFVGLVYAPKSVNEPLKKTHGMCLASDLHLRVVVPCIINEVLAAACDALFLVVATAN